MVGVVEDGTIVGFSTQDWSPFRNNQTLHSDLVRSVVSFPSAKQSSTAGQMTNSARGIDTSSVGGVTIPSRKGTETFFSSSISSLSTSPQALPTEMCDSYGEFETQNEIFWTADVTGRIVEWVTQGKEVVAKGKLELNRVILSMEKFTFSDGSQWMAVGGPHGSVFIFCVDFVLDSEDKQNEKENETEDERKCPQFEVVKDSHDRQQIKVLLFVPKTNEMWSAAMDGKICIWEIVSPPDSSDSVFQLDGCSSFPKSWPLVTTVEEHKFRINELCLVRETHVISVSFDRSIIIWDATSRTPFQTILAHEDSITAVTTIPSKEWGVSTCSRNGILCLWHILEESEFQVFFLFFLKFVF